MQRLTKNGLNEVVWQNPSYFLAFGWGSGLMPKAPGTWGTLAALPLYLLLIKLPLSIYFLMLIVLFLLGVWICEQITRELGVNDYPGIVVDEMLGLLITLFTIPHGIKWFIAGFILFRIFDIWKPLYIRKVDKHIHGGLGIMLDDVLAALPAWFILKVFSWIV